MLEQCYLGIDYGLSNIGISVGQSITKTAAALKTIHTNKRFNWQELDKIILQWQPAAIIVGNPLTEDGEEQLITRQTKNFTKKLKKRYKLPIHYVDERFSSLQAQEDFAMARKIGNSKRKNSKDLDAHAAKNILQRWLDLL